MSDQVRLGIIGAGSISIRGLLPHLTMDDVQDRAERLASGQMQDDRLIPMAKITG